jgi:hypothetical protein
MEETCAFSLYNHGNRDHHKRICGTTANEKQPPDQLQICNANSSNF